MNDTKLSNPKDLLGANKLPLHLWPETATILGCLALLDGALKYGRANWRAVGVRASIYYDACKRHLTKWFEGEDLDPDSGLPHLSHALACLAIIVDAKAAGKLNDDRAYPGGYTALVEELTPHVTRLKELYADRKPPVHYTRANDPLVALVDKTVDAIMEDRIQHRNAELFAAQAPRPELQPPWPNWMYKDHCDCENCRAYRLHHNVLQPEEEIKIGGTSSDDATDPA